MFRPNIALTDTSIRHSPRLTSTLRITSNHICTFGTNMFWICPIWYIDYSVSHRASVLTTRVNDKPIPTASPNAMSQFDFKSSFHIPDSPMSLISQKTVQNRKWDKKKLEEMPLFCIYNIPPNLPIVLDCFLFGLDTSNVVTQCAPLSP